MHTEYEGIEKKLKRQDKISAGINLQASNLKEQTLHTQNMCRTISADMQEQRLQVKEWYDEFMGKVQNINKLMLEDVDRLRARVIGTEA